MDLLCSIALYVERVCSPVAAGALETGDDAHAAGADLAHNVGEDDSIVRGVSPGHKADVVATHILQ